MRKVLSGNWIVIFIGIALIASTVLAIRNSYVIRRNQEVVQQAEMVTATTQDILTKIMHGVDLGVRGRIDHE